MLTANTAHTTKVAKMKRHDTVILAGGTELTNMENINKLENAGYLVITANNLDYALAASELFKPQTLVLDADQLDGDVGTLCRTLISRPHHPSIYVLGTETKTNIDKTLPAEHVKHMQKPTTIPYLIENIKAPRRERPKKQRRRLKAALLVAIGIAAIGIVAAAITLMLLFGIPTADDIIIDDEQTPLAQQPLQ